MCDQNSGGTEGTNVEIGKCENVKMNETPKIEVLKLGRMTDKRAICIDYLLF
jgi:hypothetical protein